MSMSTHVQGLRDPNDPEHKKKIAAAEALEAAGIPWPEALYDYFQGSKDFDAAIEVNLGIAALKWRDDNGRAGFEVDLSKLPAGVKIVRFYNSW